MKKYLRLILLIFFIISCEDQNDNIDDTKTFFIKILNTSDYNIKNISIEIESLNTGWPDSLLIDSLVTNQETEKFTFKFDNTMDNGTSASLEPVFYGSYIQNNIYKEYFTDITLIDSIYISIIVDNESYTVTTND